MRILIAAILSAALLYLVPSPAQQINNSVHRNNKQAVQAESPRKEVTNQITDNSKMVQEKALTEQQSVPEPEAVTETKTVAAPTNDKESLMQQAGIKQADWKHTDYIVSKESSWCFKRMNGDHRPCESITQPTLAQIGHKAYGLCQAYPATKMSSEGADYLTNPVTQLRWCSKYAESRYKGWYMAYVSWSQRHWW